MKKQFLIFLLLPFFMFSQLSDECKLQFGTNLGGLADWVTEQAFVDMMRYSRVWFTQDSGNPNAGFDSGMGSELELRPDGYPTHAPQTVPGSNYPQIICTIWGDTSGWESGTYIILFDGTGTLSFAGGYTNLTTINSNQYTFDFLNPENNAFSIRIETSNINDPVRNIRIIRDVYLNTYTIQPFNPTWLGKLSAFKSVRFMDWGQTNNWGLPYGTTWNDPVLKDWNERAPYDYYTWTTSKGVPYEMMVKLMNDYELDGWVCVPHSASNDYITQMATYFLNNLDPERNLTVEYSNETWNWMFGQTQWLNEYGCIQQNVTWPEGTAPYVQNCLDIWSTVWSNELNRLTRVVGVQTGWLDVAQRTAFNVANSSYDAVAATYYFYISDTSDATLDDLGSSATANDVYNLVNNELASQFSTIQDIKEQVADSINKKLVFYEGGQHLTPIPFGAQPTYANALLDIQRNTAMYNLYNSWFNFLRTLQSGNEPLQLMNFSFISSRSAQYGSWGILETQYQDTTAIYAPKYQAVMENQNFNCVALNAEDFSSPNAVFAYPNPVKDILHLNSEAILNEVYIYDVNGRLIVFENDIDTNEHTINTSLLQTGIYYVKTIYVGNTVKVIKIIKE